MANIRFTNEISDELEKIKIPGKTLDRYLTKYWEKVEETITPDRPILLNPKYWIVFNFLEDEGLEGPWEKDKFEVLLKRLLENNELDMIQIISETVDEVTNNINQRDN